MFGDDFMKKIVADVFRASLYVQDWSHRGSFNGQDAKGEQVVYVQDKDGRILVVGSGDMAFDSTNGRAKEGVGDMLVCLDPNKNETVYIKADEVTLFQTQKPEVLKLLYSFLIYFFTI